MFWKSHLSEDFAIFGKLDLNQPKGFADEVFGVRIFGFLR
jgi:hypothetical protein